MGQFAVLASGYAGFSPVRGDLGGLFIGMAIFTLIGAIRASSRWLAVPSVFLGFIVLGRILNLLFDGRSAEGVQAVILELVLIIVLLPTIASLERSGTRPFGLRLWVAVPVLLLVVLGAALLFQRQIGMTITKQVVERAFQDQLLASLPDGLHAGLCGSGSLLPDPTRAGPCVFVVAGKHVYVVDAGEGSPRKMALMGLSPGLIDAILLTHFHSDHSGGLGEMTLQRWGGASHRDPVAHRVRQRFVAAIPVVTGAEGQPVDERGRGDVRVIDGAGRFFEEILVRIAHSRQIVQFLAEGVVHHGGEARRKTMVERNLKRVVGGISDIQPGVGNAVILRKRLQSLCDGSGEVREGNVDVREKRLGLRERGRT